MKKIIFVMFFLGCLVIISTFVFSADHFTEVPEKAEMSAYNNKVEGYGKAILKEEQEELARLIETLNKANHQKSSYEVARAEDYRLTLAYNDGTAETLLVWLDFGEDFDMFQSSVKEGSYKLKDEEAREALRKIMDSHGN